MSYERYYTPPPNNVFNEIKRESIKIWLTYDDTHGYATEKLTRIKDLPNVSDNWVYMIAMFDSSNRAKLFRALSPDTVLLIQEALDE